MKKLAIALALVLALITTASAESLVKIYYNKGLQAIWAMQDRETLLRLNLNKEQILNLHHIGAGAYEAQAFANGALDIINLVENTRAGFIYLGSEEIKPLVGRASVFVVFDK